MISTFLLFLVLFNVGHHSRFAYAEVDGVYVEDPEIHMDVPSIILRWGYYVETYEAITDDGYILTLHRIPCGKCAYLQPSTNRPVIFLQHGLLCSSSVWVSNLPHQSAGFLFADLGFDVWMGNMRGNMYSKRHVYLDPESSKFWGFSWDEMAKYDLPAMIDKALNVSGQSFLYYIGHSRGTLTMFAKLSTDSSLNCKVRKFFALAPVVTVDHVRGPLQRVERLYEENAQLIAFIADDEFKVTEPYTQPAINWACVMDQRGPPCENIIFFFGGTNSVQTNKTRIAVYTSHSPDGTSIRDMVHLAQSVHHGRFQAFNFPTDQQNFEHYGSFRAPLYDLRRVSVPTYLYYSDEDWIATTRDIEGFTIPNLPPSTLKLSRRLAAYDHHDFLWGLWAAQDIYRPIADIIRSDQANLSSCT